MNRPLLVPLVAAGATALVVGVVALKACGPARVEEPVGPTQTFPLSTPPERPLPTTQPLVPPSGTIPRATAPSAPQVYPSASVAPAPRAAGLPLRPMDKDIFDLIAKANIKRLDDVFPDKPYHVRMYRDAAGGAIYLVEIDLMRKNLWEERWEFSKDEVNRELAQPGGKPPIPFALRGGRWLPH